MSAQDDEARSRGPGNDENISKHTTTTGHHPYSGVNYTGPSRQYCDQLAAQLRRRRAAARRLPPLACGCYDPLGCRHHDTPLNSEKMARAAIQARGHLEEQGFTPIFDMYDLAGGDA